MASATTNIAEIQQDFVNNILNESNETCSFVGGSSTSGNTVIISGSLIGGDATGVTSTSNYDATCTIVSSMSGTISNILSATLSQNNTSETDWFNGFQFTADTNSFDIYQSVTNNISQINQATCTSNTLVSTDNNYIAVSNSTVSGNFVGVSSDTNAQSNCSINNYMKSSTYSQAQANADQSNTIEGVFAVLAGSIAAIVGLIIIVVIILFATGAFGFIGYEVFKSHGSNKNQIPYGVPMETGEDEEV